MPDSTPLPNLGACCANQDAGFGVAFVPSPGVDLTGAVVICQIKKTVASSEVLLTPTVATSMTGTTLTAIFTWTAAQSSAIPSTATDPARATNYYVEVNLAFADAPADFVVRFWGTLAVKPGGIVA
jgi:hypothetical protein